MADNYSPTVRVPEFLSGDGEVATLMRSRDWSNTGPGAPHTWPLSLRTLVRVMLDSRYAIWIGWGPELTFLYNDAYRAMTLGKKHPWALGQPAREVWAEAWQDLAPRVDDVVERGKATYDERLFLLLERSGYTEETYHTFSYSPVPDDYGNVGGLLCIVTEETERYIAERRLKVLRELAARVANSRAESDLYAGICECLAANQHDLPFSLLYIADPEAQVAKLACSTVIREGHPAAPATLDTHRNDEPWPIRRVFERAEPVMLQDLAGRFEDLPTGAWDIIPHSALLTPISQQGQSQPAGVLIIGANPYRPMDDAYRGFIGLLAGQIAAGLAEVRAYEEEKKRAEALAEIDRAKTVFFSNVSHEFRTPLTLILTPLEELLARESASRSVTATREEIELIHRNALRLLRLVNTLLDFSRIESGRVKASFEAVDLAVYTSELASSFRSAMERAGLNYVVECEPLPEQVYIDRDMWEKVVLNLLSNAFKYTLQGEVGISVKVSSDRSHAILKVRDTGTGIPATELPRLFERFHRIEGQPGRTQEGSGIGLALVQELVRVQGGSVQVESEVGKGSVFSVSIPLGSKHIPAGQMGSHSNVALTTLRAQAFVEEAMRWLPDAPESELTVEKDLSPTPIEAAPEQQRDLVLVADDNSDMRDYIRQLLGPRYEVVTATNGLEALELIRQRRPALILSDVMMPRLDGLGLLRELRADADLRDLPLILLSARAGEEASIEGLDSGADDYLTKPFSARELMARVRTTLNLASQRRAAADALRQVNETLEQRVAEEIAARMKAQEAVRQGQRMETIGQLTGGVAHDFNNLLQVISGNLYVLQQRLATNKFSREDLTNLTEGALRGAKRATTLTQRLLAFSRRQPLDPKPVDVNRLVSGMSELLRRTLGESIAIETVLAGGLWRISVDSSELENALLNLAVNARDAMREGGRLTIETLNSYIDEPYAAASEELTPGQYVMIAVSDTGSGMSSEVIAHAFEPFFTTKDAGHGTGLGLSHVYGFVKQSGGHVKIYSERGEGTTVKVYLPRLIEERAETTIEPARPRLARATRSDIILVVEDDEDVRSNTLLMLRELGYGVVEASDGPGALAILGREDRIDLLFTDIGLPGGINGRVLSDKARELRPGLKVLFTSGYARNAIVHQGRLDPGVDLISKPFTFDQLAVKIRQVLKG